MDNKYETEEEMKERLKKEILEELKEKEIPNNGDAFRKQVLDQSNGVNYNTDASIESFGMKQKSAVSFNKTVEQKNVVNEVQNNEVVDTGKTSKLVIVILLVLCLIAIVLFPTISKKISGIKTSNKKVQVTIEKEKEKEYPKLNLNSEEVTKLKFPVMHNDRTNKVTYYIKDKITIQSFSNNDILYNTLLDIYEGNMGAYKGAYAAKYCGRNNQKVALDARYIDLRIDNLYTKNAKYTLKSFVVPANNTKTSYVGTWVYVKKTNKYVYYGNCKKVPNTNIEYYDVRVPYEVTTSDKNVELYLNNYVAFGVINKATKQYILYKNANYTEQLTSGTLTTTNYETELTNILKNYVKDNSSKTKKYKYTYTIKDCAYQDYCFLSGEWIE